MTKVQMLTHITGGRADGTVWPNAGEPLKVSATEAQELYVAQLARPWPGGDEDEQTAEAAATAVTELAVEAAVPPVAEPEPVPEQASEPEQEPEQEPETETSEPPRPGASKAEWSDYAASKGANRGWLETATKQQLMEAYGVRT